MKKFIALIFAILLSSYLLFSFKNKNSNEYKSSISIEGKTIKDRFLVPIGYERTNEIKNSFADYLRHLPLKPAGSLVRYYNGNAKSNNNVYDAVIDLPIGNRDLHQCADGIMRLRADYFYQQKQFNKIHFNFTNGFRVDYEKWRSGNRIAVKGNKTSWVKSARPSDSYESYWKYLEIIFQYAGTASLDKELKSIEIDDIKIGDVFIKGGFPGHAVIVVDVAKKGNKKVFILAQSYMPAQELQILKNPNDNSLSPWYDSDLSKNLSTPEWSFDVSQLKRFQ